MENDGSYVLATGSSAISRLRLLDEIFGADSRELLKRVGLRPGSRIADIGCGTGLMALWMARQVTEKGEVWAVDSSREQLRIAEEDSKVAGLNNLRFQEASAYDTGPPRESLDFVYSRFLMCHLTKPADAMMEMLGMIKAGGVQVRLPDHGGRNLSSQRGLRLPGGHQRTGRCTAWRGFEHRGEVTFLIPGNRVLPPGSHDPAARFLAWRC